MIDNAQLIGNSLGYSQRLPLDPLKIIEVTFRVRVLSGESAIDERAPFAVWLDNGVVRADLAVGPRSLSTLGSAFRGLLINKPFDGATWHTYRYTVSPYGIHWWVDGGLIGSAPIYRLPPSATEFQNRRVVMDIASAAASVEVDYLIVKQAPTGLENLNSLLNQLDVSTQHDPTPIPGGVFDGGRYTIVATFENTSDRDICQPFFQVDQLSFLHELEGVWVILPTEEQIQGFGGEPISSSSRVLRVGGQVRFLFALALHDQFVGGPTGARGVLPFLFFVNVAGSTIVPGSLCPSRIR